MEYVSHDGLCIDGHHPMELCTFLSLIINGPQYISGLYPKVSLFLFPFMIQMRQLRAQIGNVSKANGSAVFEMGNTKVIAAIYGPREVQNKSQQISDHALVCCEYGMANFNTGDRIRKPKGERRSTEISLVI
ncbi:hypothetical protein SLA2020_289850 [Shorea laevis]